MYEIDFIVMDEAKLTSLAQTLAEYSAHVKVVGQRTIGKRLYISYQDDYDLHTDLLMYKEDTKSYEPTGQTYSGIVTST